MGVFDPRQGQVLPSPVTNFYKGKAIRQELADAEQMAELRGLQIEQAKDEIASAPERKAAAERKAALEYANIVSQIRKRESDIGIDQMEQAKEVLQPWLVKFSEMEEKAPGSGLAWANNTFPKVLSKLPEERQAEFLQAAGEDRKLDYEEIDLMGLGILAHDADKSPDPTAHQKVINDLVERKIISREEGDKLLLEKAEKDAGRKREGSADGQRSGVRGEKVNDYMEFLGVDEPTAIKLVDGLIKMEVNEKTGRVQLLDEVTGSATEIPVEGEEIFTPAPEPGRTLWDQSDWATGPVSALKAAYNIPAAILNLPVDYKTTQARQKFRTTNQNFIRALAINPRFPVAEQNRIREEISLLPALFDAPELMRERMITINEDLELRMQQAQQDANNTRLDQEARSNAQSAANEIKNYLAILGAPSPVQIQNDEDYRALEPGTYYYAPNGKLGVKP